VKHYKCLNCGTEVDSHSTTEKCPTCGTSEFKEIVPAKHPESPPSRPEGRRTSEVRSDEILEPTKTHITVEVRSSPSTTSGNMGDFLRRISRFLKSWLIYSICSGALAFFLWYGTLNRALFSGLISENRYMSFAKELKAGNFIIVLYLVAVLALYYLPMTLHLLFAHKSAWKYKYKNKKIVLAFYGGATLLAVVIKIVNLPLDTSLSAANLLAIGALTFHYFRKKTWKRYFFKCFELASLTLMALNYILFSRWFLSVTLEVLFYLFNSLNKII
jgi:hypothetical protein